MPTHRLTLGPTPHIDISACGGHLEIRGSARENAVLESTSPNFEVDTREGDVLIVSPDASCTLRVPEGSSLTIGRVAGNCRLKDVNGVVSVGQVEGSCSLRRVGPLRIEWVQGELRVRDVQGSLAVGHVNGHFSLRDVSGPVTAERIDGHFYGHNIPSGMRIDHLAGNLALRTDFDPESVYELKVEGNADFSVPDDANVRFTIEAGGRIGVDKDPALSVSAGQRTIIFGDGSASVYVKSGGNVHLKRWNFYTSNQEYPFTFDDFSAHLDDVFAQIDAQFSTIEPTLHGLPDQVRSRVARKLDKARRRMEDAQRRVEEAVRSAARDVGDSNIHFASVNLGLAGGLGGAEPVSEQERLAVLQMLEEGKITVQEAEQLLAALEGRS
mgnify:CR=1 FL=1